MRYCVKAFPSFFRGAVDLESAHRGDLAQKIEQTFEWPLAAWRGGQVDGFSFQPELRGYSKPIAVSPMLGDRVAIGRRKGIELLKVHRDRSASLIIALAAR
jgi:hypothetical protein